MCATPVVRKKGKPKRRYCLPAYRLECQLLHYRRIIWGDKACHKSVQANEIRYSAVAKLYVVDDVVGNYARNVYLIFQFQLELEIRTAMSENANVSQMETKIISEGCVDG